MAAPENFYTEEKEQIYNILTVIRPAKFDVEKKYTQINWEDCVSLK